MGNHFLIKFQKQYSKKWVILADALTPLKKMAKLKLRTK